MLSISIADKASPLLSKAHSAIPGAAAVAGRAIFTQVREHLFNYNTTHPNRLGGPRTNFYARAAQSVRTIDDASGVIIRIPHEGIAQRYAGGTILPKRARLLTIPASPLFYATRASEHDLYRKGRALFEKGTGRIAFFLVSKVTQKPDPGVIPGPAEMRKTAQKAVEEFLRNKTNGRPD